MVKELSCSACKSKYPREELIWLNKSRKVCKSCKHKIDTDSKQYRELIDFICVGFGLQAPTGQQLKTIKKLKEHGMAYIEIHKLIYYVAVIKNLKFKGSNIEIISFYIDESNTYYSQLEKSKKSVENLDLNIETVNKKSELIYGVKIEKTRIIDINSIE